jgi:Zn finger protein HypA/HybF involved in hydrogenase expression
MTAERRILITLKDLIGMEFECGHCHARYSVALNRVDRMPAICPNCNERWISETQLSSGSLSDMVTLRRFVQCLQEVRERSLGAELRLEIAPSTLPTKETSI